MMNLAYFSEALIFIYFSWLTGWIFLNWLKFSWQSKIKRLVYPIMLGYGILGNIGLLAALIGLYESPFFYFLSILIAIFSRKKISAHLKLLFSNFFLKQALQSFLKNNKFFKIIVFFWITTYFIVNFLPWTFSDDGLFYHLPFVLKIIEKNPISFPLDGSMVYGHLPLFAEILYSLPVLIFKNFIVMRIVQFSAILLTILLIVNFAWKKVKNKKLLLPLLILILANMPFVRSGLNGGQSDVFIFLFGLASTLIIFETIDRQVNQEKNRKSLILSGIFLGLALSVKSLALFFVLANFCLLLCFYFYKKITIKNILKSFFLYSLPVVLFAGFWYVKNLIYTGNPVFPMFAEEMPLEQIGRFTIERDPINFLIFPFSFWGLDSIFKLPYAILNATYFSWLYLSGIFLLINKKITKLEIALFAFLEIWIALLFYWSHQIRFAVPALLILNLLLILFIDKIINLIIERFRISNDLINKSIYCSSCFLAITFFILSLSAFQENLFCLQSLENKKCTTAKSIFYINYNADSPYLKKCLNAYTFPLTK